VNLRIGSRLWVGLPALAVLLWACGLLVLREYPGLPTPPELTLAGQPLLRYARDITAMITLGAIVVGALLLPASSTRVLRWAAPWALAWLVASCALLAFTISDVIAVTPWEALAPGTWRVFLVETVVGRVFLAQLVAIPIVTALTLLLARRPSRPLAWATALAAGATCAAPALLGHGGITSEHIGMMVSLAVHLVAVSLWVGGLAVCVALLAIEPQRAAVLIPRFSLLALWCVIVLAESGLLNASLRMGAASLFVGTLYGSLTLAKAVLLAWLIRLGWQQRTHVVPIADDGPVAAGLLARFAGYELLLMSTAIAIGVALSRIGFESATNPNGSFTPIAVLVLALALPLLLQQVLSTRAPGRALAFLRSFPEIPAIILLVAIVEIAGLHLLDSLLGLELGVVVGAVLLVAAGWLWAASVDGPRLLNGTLLMLVGYPIVAIAVAVIAGTTSEWRLAVVCTAIAEAMLVGVLLHRRMRTAGAETVAESAHA
jgi:putative copper export protein